MNQVATFKVFLCVCLNTIAFFGLIFHPFFLYFQEIEIILSERGFFGYIGTTENAEEHPEVSGNAGG
jgi:hypothetical protein